MKEFKSYLMGKGHSSSTIESHIKVVRLFKKWLEEEAIEESEVVYRDILSYVKKLQQGELKQLTIQLYLNNLRHYFTYLESSKVISSNPVDRVSVKGVKRKILHDLFTREELEKIYQDYQEEGLVGSRNKVILGLMIYQGLGTRDLKMLMPQDLQLREGKIFIKGSRRSNEREMTLEVFQLFDLQDYLYTTRAALLKNRKESSDHLFISNNFNNLMSNLMNKLRKSDKRIKSSKQLRASVITDWLSQYNLRKVQYMAGHKYVSSTEEYEVGNLEELQNDINNFHPIVL